MRRGRGHGSNWIRREKRHRIYARDKHTCVYCEDVCELQPRIGAVKRGKYLTLDHVIPRDCGGSNEPSNLVTACYSCNSSMKCRSLREWCEVTGKDYDSVKRRVTNATRRKLPE